MWTWPAAPIARSCCGTDWWSKTLCRRRRRSSVRMAKRALSWKRAAAIGWRDLKSAPGKFGFVVLSVAIGVAALVGVRGFSESFRRTLSTEARSLIAGDLSARIFHVPNGDDDKKVGAIKQKIPGSRST